MIVHSCCERRWRSRKETAVVVISGFVQSAVRQSKSVCGDVSVGGVGACLAADLALFVSAVQGRRRRRSPGRGVQRRTVHAESLVRSRYNFR